MNKHTPGFISDENGFKEPGSPAPDANRFDVKTVDIIRECH